jgi:hypothetical protein
VAVISFSESLKMRRRLAALALLCVATAGGQEHGTAVVSRTIEGSVLDRAGHPVVGAVVLIEDLKSLQIRSYIVQEDGKFHFRGLNSDANYELRARFNGATSKPKTVSVFESKPQVVVNLVLSAKPKTAPPPTSASAPHAGNPS